MKLRKNDNPAKNRLSMLLLVFLFFLAFGGNSGQEPIGIENKNKDFHKFKLAKQMFEKGKQLVVKEEWDGAESILHQCLELFPRYSEADYYLSQVYYKKGDWDQALNHIKKAQANVRFMTNGVVPAHVENMTERKVNYHYLHGNILFKLKKYDGARSQYLETVKLNPGHISALLNLAAANFMLRQYQVAMDYLKQAEFLLGRTHPELRKAILLELEIAGDMFDLFRALLLKLEDGKTSSDKIQTFVSIYTKFSLRPKLIREDVLFTMYNNYEKYNILVDFIEKIPIQEPGTVMKLFDWVKNFRTLNKKERVLFTSLFQSLLELLSHTSKYAPNRYDYDALMKKLTDIPFERGPLYDNIFKFFKTDLNVDLNKKNLIDFVLSGINNKSLSINNTDYEFLIKEIYRKNIEEILQSQNVCSLSILLEINRLMEILSGDEAGPARFDIGNRVIQLVGGLPIGDISKKAPKYIQARVMPYSRASLKKDLAILMKYVNEGASNGELRLVVNKIKTDYLVHQLKEYLLTMAYAVNAKNPKLKVFLNPNMVRLHDFENHKDQTAWNYSGTPSITDFFSGYNLRGGLSRLNITFAAKWVDHLFGQTFIYNAPFVQSFLVNLLDFYPVPMINETLTYNALLVDFGLELLRKSRDNKTMRQEVINELSGITTGYHYRKAVDYLTERSNQHNLFFCEIKRLGETFFKKRKYLEECACKDQLETFAQLPLKAIIEDQNRWFGNIYYHTFGNLTPQQIRIFPQDVSHVFHAGWVSGEMVDEFKIKLSWLLHKKKIPAYLLGQVLYSYLNTTLPRVLSQNHYRDYSSAYFVFEIFNNAHLNGILKNLQKEGSLRLK